MHPRAGLSVLRPPACTGFDSSSTCTKVFSVHLLGCVTLQACSSTIILCAKPGKRTTSPLSALIQKTLCQKTTLRFAFSPFRVHIGYLLLMMSSDAILCRLCLSRRGTFCGLAITSQSRAIRCGCRDCYEMTCGAWHNIKSALLLLDASKAPWKANNFFVIDWYGILPEVQRRCLISAQSRIVIRACVGSCRVALPWMMATLSTSPIGHAAQ